MHILIVDDRSENLEAAKQAAKGFSEHEFRFTNSAKEAVALFTEVDAVITDLLFPNEGHEDGGKLSMLYALYRSKMINNPAFEKVKSFFTSYAGSCYSVRERLDNALAFLENGTIRRAVEGRIRFWEKGGYNEYAKDKLEEYRTVLQNLPAPQFPYGGALMLHAKELGKRLCLVSDIHRHGGGKFKNAKNAIDGLVLLLPLMNEGVVSFEQMKYDGKGSLTYLGESEIRHIESEYNDSGKGNPAVWGEAIRRILAQ